MCYQRTRQRLWSEARGLRVCGGEDVRAACLLYKFLLDLFWLKKFLFYIYLII